MEPKWSVLLNPTTWLMALSQVLFSVGPGWGICTTYGQYMKDTDEIPLSYVTAALADSGIAILAGWVIFPAVFAFGLEPDSGSNLAFITLTSIFPSMPGGKIFALLFFVALFISSITSIFGMMEVGISNLMDELKWSRKKSTVVCYLAIWVLSIPAAVIPNWLETFDTWAGCFILPASCILLYVAVTWINDPDYIRLKMINKYSDIYIGKWL